MTLEVACPACGAIVEAADEDELCQRAGEHTVEAHRYVIPREHVLAAMESAEE